MKKLNITKEELQTLYEKELDDVLEQCDWISYVDSGLICRIVSICLKNIGEEIDSEKLHKLYIAEIESLNLKDGEWSLKFGIKEIISMIYDIIESKYN